MYYIAGIPKCEQRNTGRQPTKYCLDWSSERLKEEIFLMFPRLISFTLMRADRSKKLLSIGEIAPSMLRKSLKRSKLWVVPIRLKDIVSMM